MLILLENSKLICKKYYDKNAKASIFNIGDDVVITKENRLKHESLYDGPYKITNVDEHNITVNIKNKLKTVHKNRVKHFHV